MAIYHFSAQIIKRKDGRSAVAAAAYRGGTRLFDERLGVFHDFTKKSDVIYSEVMLPIGAPAQLADPSNLWNAAEAAENRVDARVAREFEVAIPRELGFKRGIEVARDFVRHECVRLGMIADFNVHAKSAADGASDIHCHVMLTTRSVNADGFGPKVRDWNKTTLLEHWREAWANYANQALALLDVDLRIDHRSNAAQGIKLEAQNKIAAAAERGDERGEGSERVDDHGRIARENGAKLIADPTIALDAITKMQATFTHRDLAMFVHRHSDDKEQFDAVMAAVLASPELVVVGKDSKRQQRLTGREMITVETRLEEAAAAMAGRNTHGVAMHHVTAARASGAARGMILSAEQDAALDHLLGGAALKSLVGLAGTGKSAMLGIGHEAWKAEGYRVRGIALSGIAAENLEGGSGIASRTIASLELQWSKGNELLTDRDIVVIDEAGMVGTRQMERVMSAAAAAGAKVVLVGDPEQLQAIEAGAAFRALVEQHGAVEMTGVRRQRADWQRDATVQLATGKTGEALAAYRNGNMVHAAGTRGAALEALIASWDCTRMVTPDKSQLILTHTNAAVRELNEQARARVRLSGALGKDVTVAAERGERSFATGDRVMFLKNERGMGVKNGTLATIKAVTAHAMTVRLDDGREVAFDLKNYTHIDHGYAATIHKSQGVTVDQVHVLATPGLDRHATYVAMTRHRDGVELHYGRDDFADDRALARTLSRERAKDVVSDYAIDSDRIRVFADRRDIAAALPIQPAAREIRVSRESVAAPMMSMPPLLTP